MSLFYYPTKNSWDEDIFALTGAGIGVLIVLIALLLVAAILVFTHKRENKAKLSATQLAVAAVCMALGVVTSEIIPSIPVGIAGGSITLFSMLFITVIGYWYGFGPGLMCAVAYGLLQLVLDPKVYSLPQMLVDYPLAFGALGLSGLFSKNKFGLVIGYVVGVLGRYVFAVLSGILFFASYAPENQSVLYYSLTYNATYIVPELVVTVIILFVPPVAKAFKYAKKIATNNN